jgi:RNA polymerase sigma-70 factor, ECF subfamily
LSIALTLLERAKAGDATAFGEMIRPYVDPVRRLARSFCRNNAEADDLAQEALVKAYKAFGSFDGRAALTTWLYSIAKNQFLDHRRSKLFRWRQRESEYEDVGESPLPNSEELLGEREEVDRLWNAVRQIDEKYRIPMVLADIDGLSYEEVAQIEKIPVGTVKSRIARGKEQLRALLSTKTGTREGRISSYSMLKGDQ